MNSSDNRLPSVIESLAEINNFIQQDKKIRMILVLWSRYSPKCAEFINSIPNNCKRFFYPINIDNPEVRNSILNSSSIKVSEVPCVIVVGINGTVSTYEGDASNDIIKSIHSIVGQMEKMKTVKKSTVTPLSDILGGKPSQVESGEGGENEVYENGEEEDESSRHSQVRQKVRRAERPMDPPDRIKQQDPPSTGLSSARSYPVKGVGHSSLARSSLGSDIKPSSKSKPLPVVSGGEMLDDDLDDMMNEDVTMDPIIKSTMESGRGDKKEAMMNVKKAAEEMMRMREQEEED